MSKSKSKIFFFFLFYLLSNRFTTKGQTANYDCNCEMIVEPTYLESIEIFESPNGNKILRRMKNDDKNEDYLGLHISNDSCNMFKGSIYFGLKSDSAVGWIKKLGCIGVYARYSENPDTLNLFSLPDKISSLKVIVPKYTPNLFWVKHCKNNWLYVEIKIDNQKYEGWLSPDQQCANPYTTCN